MVGVGLSLGRNHSSVVALDEKELAIVHRFKIPNFIPFTGKTAGFIRASNPAKFNDNDLPKSLFNFLFFLGRKPSDPQIQSKVHHIPEERLSYDGTEYKLTIEGRKYSVEDVFRKIIGGLKKFIDNAVLSTPKVILTHPVSFDAIQQQRLQTMCQDLGVPVHKLLDEHTAAACNHVIPQTNKILVFDLSQRTFHVSILSSVDPNNVTQIGRTTLGNEEFGGFSFAETLLEYCLQELKTKRRIDLKRETNNDIIRRTQEEDLAHVYRQCQDAVIALSSEDLAIISLHGKTVMKVTRQEFEAINTDNFHRCLQLVDKVLAEGKTSKKEVEHVILEGKSCHMPKITEMLREYFGDGLQFYFSPQVDSAANFAASLAVNEEREMSVERATARMSLVDSPSETKDSFRSEEKLVSPAINHFRTEKVPLLMDTIKRLAIKSNQKQEKGGLQPKPKPRHRVSIVPENSYEISEAPTSEEVEEFEELLRNGTSRQDVLLEVVDAIYKDNMDKVMTDPDPIDPTDLLETHEVSVQLALKTLSKVLPLNQHILRTVKQKLDGIYGDYKDINNLKGKSKAPAIGIDLGTTYCYSAIFTEGSEFPRVIPNDMGNNATPSHLFFPSDGAEPIVGEAAKSQAASEPDRSIFDVKRILGRSLADERIQALKKYWPFELIQDGRVLKVKVGGKLFLPEVIISKLITYIKHCAEDHFGEKVINAVVTVPAYFNDRQRALTKEACKMAGLNVLQFLNEPTAAAIAYGLHQKVDAPQERHCLIFDLGGGTLDIAVLQIRKKQIQIKAIEGDPYLGGEDFDQRMMQHCFEECWKKHGRDIAGEEDSPARKYRRLRRVKMECEKQKCLLSAHNCRRVTVNLDSIFPDVDLSVVITRELFEQLIDKDVKKCVEVVDHALRKAGLSNRDIAEVVLVGGSSRIPKIQDALHHKFPSSNLNKSINPDEAVASGAAILASFKENPELPNISIQEIGNTVWI